MHYYAFLIVALSFRSIVSAHMLLSYPPAFRYQNNPNVPSGSIDYSLTSPLKADGSDFPCKGYQSDLGSPAGASVATWSAGGTYNFTIGGSAAHDGGSCQAALSYDKGKTFRVIHSYIGGCPTVSPAGGSFNFQVPSDAPQGAAMFAWTWFNEVGNREMYMDCASVTITGSSSKRAERAGKRAGTSFSSRPSLFVANLGNGCTTVESTDLAFPDPGPDVTNVSKAPGGVTGTCKQVAGIGDFASGSGNAASSPAGSSVAASSAATAGTSAGASSAAPVASASSINAGAGTVVTAASSHAASSYAAQTSSGSQAVTMSSAASTASSTGTSTSGLSLSSDGSCGGTFGCQGSIHGNCCSEWGWCGNTSAYCGTGCQSAFGSCGTSNSSSSGTSALQVSIDKTCGPTTSNTCQGSTYGNCCSQYGYCGSTSDYCGTGCQGGFGTCGLASAGSSPSSSSSMAVSNQSAMPSSSPASQATGGASATGSSSSVTSLSSTGMIQPTSQGSSGFITMAKPTTTTSNTISTNGLCGSSTGYTCMGSNFGECCSQYGYCGSSDAYCGKGCQNPFGSCKIEIIPTTL